MPDLGRLHDGYGHDRDGFGYCGNLALRFARRCWLQGHVELRWHDRHHELAFAGAGGCSLLKPPHH